jgi:hypothetical protein
MQLVCSSPQLSSPAAAVAAAASAQLLWGLGLPPNQLPPAPYSLQWCQTLQQHHSCKLLVQLLMPLLHHQLPLLQELALLL